MRKLLFPILLLVAVACLPQLPDVPTATPAPSETPQYLNVNPGMVFGGCNEVEYTTGTQFPVTHKVTQCYPAGYTIYEDTNLPVPIAYRGAGYTVELAQRTGDVGFVLPEARLDEGCYLVKVSGLANMYGNLAEYGIDVTWQTPEMASPQLIGRHVIQANGNFIAAFVLDAPARLDYVLTEYIHVPYNNVEANSYIQIQATTVEAVPSGFCGR